MAEPILQRLELYGFAWVQIDPRIPIEPWRWRLPGLQAWAEHHAWRTIFGNCQSASLYTSAPLISPSLSFLAKIRQKQPGRGLIYCQTAFDNPRKSDLLRRLPWPRKLPFLASEDALTPVLWLPKQNGSRAKRLADYPINHPLASRLRSMQSRFPNHQFWCQEDGRIVVQGHLFDGKWPEIERSNRALAWLDAYLQSQIASMKGGWLVAARTQRQLAWFKCDMARVDRSRFRFFRGPVPRFKEIYGDVFVPVIDRSLRWGHANLKGWPILHLDGDSRRIAFRQARLLPVTLPTWFWASPIIGEAEWPWGGRTLKLQKTESGWRSLVVKQFLRDLTPEFRNLVQCFADVRNAKSRP